MRKFTPWRVAEQNPEKVAYCWKFEAQGDFKADEDFGVTDKKGRAVGARVRTYTETYEALTPELAAQYADIDRFDWKAIKDFQERHAPEGASRQHSLVQYVPGTYYVVYVGATRDGCSQYAASTIRYFPTIRERDAYIAKYFRRAADRAIKQWRVE